MKTLYLLVAFLSVVGGARGAGADLIISEFMASNLDTLLDEDNDSSDWIEIYNGSTAAVDLEGWHLTDDPRILDKWAFPAVSIDAASYLLVFASGKNRRVAGNELHTNFRISAGGEYLALVEPDGVTVAHQYAPVFPEQLADCSYGIGQDVQITYLVPPKAPLRHHIPADGSLGTSWIADDFDDSGWSEGTTGIGYMTTVPGFAVRNYKATVSVGDLGTAEAVIDDPGFRSSVETDNPEVIDYQGTASSGHYAVDRPFPGTVAGADVDDFVVEATGIVTIPTAGAWTFGVMSDDGFRLVVGSGASSFTIEHGPPRGAADTLGVYNVPAPGDYALRLIMYERGGGSMVELFAAYGSHGSWSGSFRLVGDTAGGGLEVRSAASEVAGLAGLNDVIKTDVEDIMLGVNGSAYVRIPFTLDDPTAFESLFLKMKYDDGFIAYLNGQEVASRNAPATALYNATATADRPGANAGRFEDLNISSALMYLQPGPNVLAFHALNDAPDSDDFLLYAELADITILSDVPNFFDVPTPGQPNSSGFLSVVRDTRFSHDRGFYTDPFDLEITTDTVGADIHYTLDGTTPSATHGFLYDGPIRIDRTTVVRAAAFRSGHIPTNVDTHTYLFLDDVILQDFQATLDAGFPASWGDTPADYGFDMAVIGQNGTDSFGGKYAATIKDDLKAVPTMSIVVNVDHMFGPSGIYTNATSRGESWERPCSVELIYPHGAGGFQEDCGIRIQGGAFRRHSLTMKHSFRLFFKGEYGATKLRYPIFGPGVPDRFDTITLRANANDAYTKWGGAGDKPLFVRDSFMCYSQIAMGQAASHGVFVHLYINGIYWGMYNPVERPDHSFSATYYGGHKDDWDSLNHTGPNNGTRDSWNTMVAMANAGLALNEDYFLLQGKNLDGTDNPALEDWLDVENFADYMIVNLWGGNGDWPGHNYYMARRRVDSTGYKCYSWDAEWVLGIGSSLSSNKIGVDNGIAAPWQPLRANAEFRMLFADRVHEHFFNGGPFAVDPANPQWDPAHPERNVPAERFAGLAAIIDRAVAAECARWGDQAGGSSYTRDEHWAVERQRVLDDWMPYRTARVVQQLRSADLYPSIDAPSFSQHGGPIAEGFVLRIVSSAGTIYYTLDGSDPRLLGGDIAPSVHTIDAPIPVIVLDDATATGRVLVPQDGSLGLTWTEVGFDDSAWTEGSMGVGYERGSGYEDHINTDVGDAMYGTNASVYIRLTFSVADPNAIASLKLLLMYEDGFAAYINGQRIAADNVPATLQWDSAAAGNRSDGDAVTFVAFPLGDPAALLRSGENVLAIHGLNTSTTSSDVLFVPRLEGSEGELGENAVVLNETTWVRARARSGAEWSALNEALFYVPTPLEALRITEIMYHPREDDIVDGDLFEFIEIKNTGPKTLDLTGVSFSSGIRFEFPEGTILPRGALGVLVVDRDAFLVRYPDLDPGVVMGVYGGNLSNNGEIVTLIDPLGETITSATYDDAPPWPVEADGLGPSLVPIDPNGNGDPNKASSWRVSWFQDGSPGEDDPSEMPVGGWQLPGDLNQDARLDISDAIAMLVYLFVPGDFELPCDDAAGGNVTLLDLNGDAEIDLADSVYLLGYLFAGGPSPIRGSDCIFIEGCPDTCP